MLLGPVDKLIRLAGRKAEKVVGLSRKSLNLRPAYLHKGQRQGLVYAPSDFLLCFWFLSCCFKSDFL